MRNRKGNYSSHKLSIEAIKYECMGRRDYCERARTERLGNSSFAKKLNMRFWILFCCTVCQWTLQEPLIQRAHRINISRCDVNSITHFDKIL